MKGSIYVIRSHQTTDIYIGSTIQLLCQRMASHKRDYKKWIQGEYHNVSSFDILKYDDAYIELIEEGIFESKQLLHAKEGHYIRTMDCVNKNIPCRTQIEWREDNKEKLAIIHKKWRNDNKEKRQEQRKQYYLNNKEEINKIKKERRKAKKIYTIIV